MKIGLLCGREFSFPPAFIERVNTLGREHGITAEMVSLGGTPMLEPARYAVIVDRISHEIEYYRGFLKHAALQGTHVINNPFWWTADDKFFNYAVAAKLGIAIPKTVLLPQKDYPKDVDLTPESLRNLQYPIDWEGLLDHVGRPAILKPYLGRRLETRLQGRRCLRAAGGVRSDGAVLHDAAGVHRLRAVRPLLHVRQDRHHPGCATIRVPGGTWWSTSTSRRRSARGWYAMPRRSIWPSATR